MGDEMEASPERIQAKSCLIPAHAATPGLSINASFA
jgi:hypothetical protein